MQNTTKAVPFVLRHLEVAQRLVMLEVADVHETAPRQHLFQERQQQLLGQVDAPQVHPSHRLRRCMAQRVQNLVDEGFDPALIAASCD